MRAISSFKTGGITKQIKPNPSKSFLSFKSCHCASLLTQLSPNSLNVEPETPSFCSREPSMGVWNLTSSCLPYCLILPHSPPPASIVAFVHSAHWSGATIPATLILNPSAPQALLSLRSLFQLLQSRWSAPGCFSQPTVRSITALKWGVSPTNWMPNAFWEADESF